MSLTNPPSSAGPLSASRPVTTAVSQSLSLRKSLQAAVEGNTLVSLPHLV